MQYLEEKKMVHFHEQDTSSDIEKQPPFGDRKYSKALPQKRKVQSVINL